MTDDLETRIRMRAHDLWQREGRPDGRDADHWREAEQEIAREDSEAEFKATPEAAPAPPEGTPPLSPRGGVAGPRQAKRSAGAASPRASKRGAGGGA
ncbi:MAG: DUF2934 domain-containing protein [Albimonas sp.]|uniref:DUF2934 domain-containing protein n=1 Tax=Albimonas sp. TaxID=1872425 RepID=UPI0040567FB2